MAGGKSDALENSVLEHVFGVTSYTPPAHVHVELYTVTPTDAMNDGTKCTGGSYAPVQVTASNVNFSTAVAGEIHNATAITFPAATADWGTAVAFGIFAADGTTGMYWGPVSPEKVISTGDTASFAATTLSITEG